MTRAYSDRNGPATRREILTTLTHEPGITKSQLCRRLNLSWSSIWHHVRRLDEEKLLVSKTLYGRTRLYIAAATAREVALLPLLREEANLRILGILAENPGLRIQEVSRATQLTRKQVKRRLKFMHVAGLVDRTGEFQAKFSVREATLVADRPQIQDGKDLR